MTHVETTHTFQKSDTKQVDLLSILILGEANNIFHNVYLVLLTSVCCSASCCCERRDCRDRLRDYRRCRVGPSVATSTRAAAASCSTSAGRSSGATGTQPRQPQRPAAPRRGGAAQRNAQILPGPSPPGRNSRVGHVNILISIF